MKWLDYIKVKNGIIKSGEKVITKYSDLIATEQGDINFGNFLYAIGMTYLMEVKGAGVTAKNDDNSNRQDYLAKLKDQGGIIWFEPEQGNRWDASAVKIIWGDKCLGYIPRICKVKENMYFNPDKYIFLGYEVIGGGTAKLDPSKKLSYGISIKLGQIHE